MAAAQALNLTTVISRAAFRHSPCLSAERRATPRRCCGVRAAGKGDVRFPLVAIKKDVDLVTLGNLCVDIVLPVPRLPPEDRQERKAYMERLAASPPDKKFWEAGGNSNLAIAAARLGLHCVTLGHVGEEIYGNFLLNVLQDEHIGTIAMMEKTDGATCSNYQTLLCWVLVDPLQKHGFCSIADFSKEPAFSWIGKLSGNVRMAIQSSKILFCNGYAFDEFFPDIIVSAINCAIDMETAVFFDPGPRGTTLQHGTPDERRALESALKLSDVLLLTADEAESLTGMDNPVQAGQDLLRRGDRTKWVVVKMGAHGSLLITKSRISYAPSFKVDIVDTVGCGDSFTAAIVFGFLRSLSPVGTLILGNAVGAATATGCGAGRNVASLDSVKELLRQSDLNEDDALCSYKLIEGAASSMVSELSIVTKVATAAINGQYRDGKPKFIPICTVVSELLPMFEVSYESVS